MISPAADRPDPSGGARFEAPLRLPVSARRAWDWHARPGAFDDLVPPWLRVKVRRRYTRLEDGARLVFDVCRPPFSFVSIRWHAVHEEVIPGERFVDVQEKGPFASWRHEHIFRPDGDGCRLVDRVTYRLPFHGVSHFFAAPLLQWDLEKMFAWRHRTTLEALVGVGVGVGEEPARLDETDAGDERVAA